MDIMSVVRDRGLTDTEACALIKENCLDKARREVDYFLNTTEECTLKALIAHLSTAFRSGEDESSISQEFYSRQQRHKETPDQFADELQILARKLIMVRPSFKVSMDRALKNQYASNLRDGLQSAIARAQLPMCEDFSFTEFRGHLANILALRKKTATGKIAASSSSVSTSTVDGQDIETETESWKSRKLARQAEVIKTQSDSIKKLSDKLDAVLAKTNQYQEVCQPDVIQKVVSQALSCYQQSADTARFPTTFKGKPRAPQCVPGVDGQMDPSQTCRYCKDNGHWLNNCRRIKAKEERARAAERAAVASLRATATSTTQTTDSSN